MRFLSDCKDTENARAKEISLLLFAFAEKVCFIIVSLGDGFGYMYCGIIVIFEQNIFVFIC